jgi:hypothetical protein
VALLKPSPHRKIDLDFQMFRSKLSNEEEIPDIYFRSQSKSTNTPSKAMACASHRLDIFPVFPTAVVAVGAGAAMVVPMLTERRSVEAV